MSMEFLYLSHEDMIKAGVLDMKKCVETMDEMFQLLGKGDYLMGSPYGNHHGMMPWFPIEPIPGTKIPVAGPDRRFMCMPAYLGGRFNVCGNKWYGSNVENAKKGLPRSILTVNLNDPDTGAPLAFMSANLLSSTRTGAVPGVAVRYLQSSNAKVIGIIGAGAVSRTSLMAIMETLKNRDQAEVRVYDIFREKAEAFCQEMNESYPAKYTVVDSSRAATEDCDIVSCGASALAPVPMNEEWLKPGVLVLVTGAADVTEETYKNNTVVFDNWKMHAEWLAELGDHPERCFSINAGHPSAPILMMVAKKQLDPDTFVSLGDVIADPAGKGRKSDDEKIFFVTGGMGTEDVAWGFDCYQEALRQGIGQKITLWENPPFAKK